MNVIQNTAKTVIFWNIFTIK